MRIVSFILRTFRWVWSGRLDLGTGDTDLSLQAVVGLGLRVGKARKNTVDFRRLVSLLLYDLSNDPHCL